MENLVSKLDKIDIHDQAEEATEADLKWEMELTEIYKLSLKFYKGDDKEFFLLTKKVFKLNVIIIKFQTSPEKLCI